MLVLLVLHIIYVSHLVIFNITNYNFAMKVDLERSFTDRNTDIWWVLPFYFSFFNWYCVIVKQNCCGSSPYHSVRVNLHYLLEWCGSKCQIMFTTNPSTCVRNKPTDYCQKEKGERNQCPIYYSKWCVDNFRGFFIHWLNPHLDDLFLVVPLPP